MPSPSGLHKKRRTPWTQQVREFLYRMHIATMLDHKVQLDDHQRRQRNREERRQ